MPTTTKLVAKFVKTFSLRDRASLVACVKELEASGEYVKVQSRRDGGYAGTATVRGYVLAEVEEKATAECQICARQQAINARGELAHHGYTRPGWGFINGTCFGSRHVDYATSSARLAEYVRALETGLESRKAHLEETKAATEHRFPIQRYLGQGKYETTTYVARQEGFEPLLREGFSSWESAHARAVREAEGFVRAQQEAVNHFTARLAAAPVK